jgi:hypothetical protein
MLKVAQMSNGFQGETIVTSNYFQKNLNTHQGYGKLSLLNRYGLAIGLI